MNMETEARAPAVTLNQIHWNTSDLLEVPPVTLVTEIEPSVLRQRLATFVDGRHANDVLYRAVVAMRSHFGLEPHAYVVVFPALRLELPVDLRPLSDQPENFVGIVKAPRGTSEEVFDLAELHGRVADELSGLPREAIISVLKEMSEDGQEFLIHDQCDPSDRFAHTFASGKYWHNYRYIASELPGMDA
jgi:hypothetical protein